MKTIITLELKTQEAHQLFKRTINGNRLFIDAILHKLNKVIRLRKKGMPKAEEHYHITKQHISNLTQHLETETKRFLDLIQKNPILKSKTITFKAAFFPKICVEHSLTLELIRLVQQYDALISTVKLLHLSGCFENTRDYYLNIKRIQVIVNYGLSQIITGTT